MLLQNKRGFTLVELLIVMVVFLVIIMITAAAFKTIVNSSSQQSKSVETQIQGIVGLEVLRADLEQIGFGLPYGDPWFSGSSTIEYKEATDANTIPTAFWRTGGSPALFNDAPGNAPRAILSGTTTFNIDSDGIGSSYLVVKSTLAVANNTSKKWTTVSFDKDNAKTVRQWGSPGLDFISTDHVIVVKDSHRSSGSTRQLMATSNTVFSAAFSTYSTLTTPHQNGDIFSVYGVNPNTSLWMPFNRADYYVRRPTTKMPSNCSDNTGILYKSTVIHSNGGLALGMPLLDCVADMQVVYGLAEPGTSVVNTHSSDITSFSASDIRDRLKEIRVYILAQEGAKDSSYNYPNENIVVGEKINGIDRGRNFNLKNLLGTNYKYYRWKVYTIVVRPKNLIQ